MKKYKSASIPESVIAKLPPQAQNRLEMLKKFSNGFTRDFDNDMEGDLLEQEDQIAYECIMGSSKSDTSPKTEPKTEPKAEPKTEPSVKDKVSATEITIKFYTNKLKRVEGDAKAAIEQTIRFYQNRLKRWQ